MFCNSFLDHDLRRFPRFTDAGSAVVKRATENVHFSRAAAKFRPRASPMRPQTGGSGEAAPHFAISARELDARPSSRIARRPALRDDKGRPTAMEKLSK